jgi:3-oxoacyl-[acyl-carrier protein] reductase
MLFPDHDVAIVTGGSRGIGRAIALDLAAEGATVVVNYVKNADAAEEVVKQIHDHGGQATAFQADVSKEEDVRRLFRSVRRGYGSLRILVNNAGATDDGFLLLMSAQKWRRVQATNLDSTFLCSREALRLIARNAKTGRPGGVIVNIASVSGIAGVPGQLNYSAAKGGVIALTRGLAKETAAMGVRVNAVAPGFVDTDMIRDLPPEIVDAYSLVVPMGRIGRVEEVASVASFLASDKASYITGQVISVDGGCPH